MFFFVPGLDAELLRVARLASTQVSLDRELRSGFTNLEVGQSEKADIIVPANDNVTTKGDGKADGASKFPEIIHVLPWLPPRSSETPSLQTLEHRIQEKVWTTSGPSALHHQTPDAKNSAGLEKAGGSSSSLRQDMRLHDGSRMECSGLEKASETHVEMNADVKVKVRCNRFGLVKTRECPLSSRSPEELRSSRKQRAADPGLLKAWEKIDSSSSSASTSQSSSSTGLGKTKLSSLRRWFKLVS